MILLEYLSHGQTKDTIYMRFHFRLAFLSKVLRNAEIVVQEISRRFVNILPTVCFLDFLSYLYGSELVFSAAKHPQIHPNNFFGGTGLLIDADFLALHLFSVFFPFRVSLTISFRFFFFIINSLLRILLTIFRYMIFFFWYGSNAYTCICLDVSLLWSFCRLLIQHQKIHMANSRFIFTIWEHVDAKTNSIAFEFEKCCGCDGHNTNTDNQACSREKMKKKNTRKKEMRCEFKIQECKSKTAQQPNDIIIQSNVNIDSAICYLFCSRLNVSFCDLAARFVFILLVWYSVETEIIWNLFKSKLRKRLPFEFMADIQFINERCKDTWRKLTKFKWNRRDKKWKELIHFRVLALKVSKRRRNKVLNTITHYPPIQLQYNSFRKLPNAKCESCATI